MKMEPLEDIVTENKEVVEEKDWKHWLKTLCGFANTKGGELRFGWDDSGNFIGFSRKEADDSVRKIRDIVSKHSRPRISYDVSYKMEDDKYGIILSVQKRSKCLNWLIDDSITPQIYIRHEGETAVANEEEMSELCRQVQNDAYDSISVGFPMEKPTFNELNEEYGKHNNDEQLTKKLLISYGLLKNDGSLSLAGYLFCDNTTYDNNRIVCNTWPELTKGSRKCDNTKSYSGSIIQNFNNVLDYIYNVSFYKFGFVKDGVSTRQNGSFSKEVLREAIINAIAHRDYRLSESEIQVNCFKDRIEFVSPGNSLNCNNSSSFFRLQDVSSERRNKVICEMLVKCKLMEEKGSGFDLIIDEYQNMSDEYYPTYCSNRLTFTLVIRNKKYDYGPTALNTALNGYLNSPLFVPREALYEQNSKYKEIESLIKSFPNITLEGLSKELGMTREGVKYYIVRMKEAGLLRRIGGTRGKYEITNELDRPAYFNEIDPDEKNAAINWCKKNFISTKGFDTSSDSYGLKHILQGDTKLYLTNGQFKAAMLLAGFRCKDTAELNWCFNISRNSSAFHLNVSKF